MFRNTNRLTENRQADNKQTNQYKQTDRDRYQTQAESRQTDRKRIDRYIAKLQRYNDHKNIQRLSHKKPEGGAPQSELKFLFFTFIISKVS